ncbi:glutamate-1-semialdehyde 2,1-aminomutase [Bacteroides sp.]|uniref:glutamate-1-semialdehyde 2,1-aminomutase n=1 Tax=Bacteroides sp. TaxID=29523 RepID=UPI002FCC343A
MLNRTKSIAAYKEALKYIPGGVNSPVRALKAVGENPLFIERAKGVILTDVDGNDYIDFCLSWGVFILGHAHSAVLRTVNQSIKLGTSYGIPTLQETELARRVNHFIPSMERVRFVNSGTEAVMSAIRLARGYTNRNLIVKFVGCYHGHVDHLLVGAGSGVTTLASALSAGVPDAFVAYTLCLPFNDKKAVDHLFSIHGKEIAAVIVEPVPANMGVVPSQNGFLHYLREVTLAYGALLIFDEVITGFRLTAGGAQQLFNITPDLTTVGKIVGGGFPAAAFGGRADIMQMLAPEGDVYQAGTLSGNPVAMSAGIKTLDLLSQQGVYDALNKKAGRFVEQLRKQLAGKGIVINAVGNMFTLFFTEGEVNNFEDVRQCDTVRFGSFFRYMLAHGVYLSPSQFEACFVSVAHTEKQLDRVASIAGNFNG